MLEERNYEFRTIPEVSPRISVSRDGEIRVDGKDDYSMGGMIEALDGSRMPVQKFIHKAFPDIPLRYGHLFEEGNQDA